MDDNANIITMVDRVGLILEFIFQNDEPVGVSKISSSLDLPKATVFRILTTLQKWNMVEKYNNTNDYIMGKSMIRYGNKAKSEIDLIEIAKTPLKNLSSEIGETTNLAIHYKGYVLNLISEEGESSVLVSKLIPISPLNCSSMGKIFLSHYSNDELEHYFRSDLVEKRTQNSITTLREFLPIRKSILKDDIAYDDEEYEYGLSCMGCPIKDNKGNIIAAISVSAPTSRLEFKGKNYAKEKLIETATTINELAKFL